MKRFTLIILSLFIFAGCNTEPAEPVSRHQAEPDCTKCQVLLTLLAEERARYEQHRAAVNDQVIKVLNEHTKQITEFQKQKSPELPKPSE